MQVIPVLEDLLKQNIVKCQTLGSLQLLQYVDPEESRLLKL